MKLDINLIRRLTDKRLKSMKTSQYKKLGIVSYVCTCCNERHVIDQTGWDTVMENINMISKRQQEIGNE